MTLKKVLYLNHKLLDDDVQFLRPRTPKRRAYCSGEPHKITTTEPL